MSDMIITNPFFKSSQNKSSNPYIISMTDFILTDTFIDQMTSNAQEQFQKGLIDAFAFSHQINLITQLKLTLNKIEQQYLNRFKNLMPGAIIDEKA